MKKTIVITCAVIGMFLAASCGKMLEVTPPNSITDEQIQDIIDNGTESQRIGFLNGICAPMIQYFNFQSIQYSTGAAAPMVHTISGINWARGLQGNDLAIGKDQGQDHLAGKAYYDFTVDFTRDSDYSNYAHWFGYAKGINQANLLLGYMTEEAAKGSDIFKDGRARGLLVRAYCYMSLMEEYQDAYLQGGKSKLGLPLYTEYNPLQEPKARESAEATYAFIKKDLNEAITLLTAIKKGYTNGYTEAEDFDLGLANFLLARVSLWTGDNTTCINACKAIIDSQKYSFIKEENYGGHNEGTWTPDDKGVVDVVIDPSKNAFTCIKVNPETILGFRKASSYKNFTLFSLSNPFCGYAANGTMVRIDDRLYNQINENDYRKDAFRKEEIGTYSYSKVNASLPSYVALKFAATLGIGDNGVGYSKTKEGAPDKDKAGEAEEAKFRLSEVYLMKAEAENASGKTTDATNTINELLKARTRTGAPTLTYANYGSNLDLTKFIQLQWRIEMWGENGREYFNNKRWGIDVNRSGSLVHKELGKDGITYSYKNMTCQIPDKEMETNPLCEQNK